MGLNLSNLPLGTRLGGAGGERYKVGQKLGEGGMGVVYLAEDTTTDNECALKVLHDGMVQDAQARESFAQEARAPGKFRQEVGDFVVKVFDAGICPKTHAPFMAMEKLNGEELGARIERLGRLPPAEVLLVAEGLSLVLDEAARQSLVHRDLKPENLFLARVGGHPIPKVMDFGLAKVIHAGSIGKSRMIGTPVYMAPEQFEAKGMSPRTDIWAMGLIVFTALTGMVFWRNTDNEFQVMCEVLFLPRAKAAQRAAEGKVELPVGFDGWFARCTENNPERRFQTAGEAFHALEPVLRPLTQEATHGDSQAPPPPSEKRSMAATVESGEGLDERIATRGPLTFPELVNVLEQLITALNELPEDQARRSLSCASVRFHPRGGSDVLLGDLRPRETVQRANGRSTTQATTTRMNTIELTAQPVEFIIGQKITPRGDVWSIGTIAFYALVGAPIWRAEIAGALLKEILSGVMPVASVRAKELGREAALPSGFDIWFSRCLQNTPTARWRDPATAVMRLRALTPTVQPVVAPVTTSDAPKTRLVPVSVALLGLGALSLLGWKVLHHDTRQELTIAERVAERNPWRSVSAVPGLLVQEHEITRAEFALVGALGPLSDPSLPRTDVTWEDAARFCSMIGGSLPRMDQWRAARGTPNWQNRVNFPHALHSAGASSDRAGDIFDMVGNVGEWMLDTAEGGHLWAGALFSDTNTDRINARLESGTVSGPGARVGFRCVRSHQPP